MSMSPTIGKIAEALAKAQSEIKGAIKDSENPYFKSRYADLASVWEAIREPLAKNNLAVIQTMMPHGESHINIVTTLAHSSGEWIQSHLPVRLTKPDPQALGSVITYGRRYALAAMVGVSQVDDDAEAAMNRSQVLASNGKQFSEITSKTYFEPLPGSEAPTKEQVTQFMKDQSGDQFFVGGKHQGKTFRQVLTEDVPGNYKYAKSIKAIVDTQGSKANETVLKFYEYARSMGVYNP